MLTHAAHGQISCQEDSMAADMEQEPVSAPEGQTVHAPATHIGSADTRLDLSPSRISTLARYELPEGLQQKPEEPSPAPLYMLGFVRVSLFSMSSISDYDNSGPSAALVGAFLWREFPLDFLTLHKFNEM